MASHGFIQLPPDGAGKQVPQSVMAEVRYDTGTTAFTVGDPVSFSVSTEINGTIISIDTTSGTTGKLHIRIDEPVPSTIIFSIGENIIVKTITYAKVVSADQPLYFQNTVLVGANMANPAEVDRNGSLKTTFTNGSPQFDAFGKLLVSTQHKLADYVMTYDELPHDFTTEITGGASLVYNNDTRGVTMTCGLASGDRVVRTTDEYHVYQPGLSQLIEFTGSIGDTGKANVIRRSGYYDDNNGVYFEFKETELGVGLRSKSSGSVVDTFIPQEEWNKDRLDGSDGVFNPSGKTADPTNNLLYWIDLQWLGAGIVRYGFIIEGIRIVAHELYNVVTQSYMSSASLPFRYEQENIGIAGSSSEFRMFCGAVFTEGKFNPFIRAFSDSNSTSVTTVDETLLMTMRAAQLHNTFDNRSTLYPASFDVYNSAAEPILFTMRRGSTATAGSWVAVGGESTAELNKTSTASTGGAIRFASMIAPGETKPIPFPALEHNRRGLRRKADITQWTEMQLAAQLVVAGAGGNIYIIVNWDEVRD